MWLPRAVMNCGLIFLCGCTVFSSSKQTKTSHGPASAVASNVRNLDLKSVAPGDWCRVKMQEVDYGFVRRQTEYVGRIDQIALDSVTLTDVATRVWNLESVIDKIPVLNRWGGTTIETKELLSPVEVPLDSVASIEWISPENLDIVKGGRPDSHTVFSMDDKGQPKSTTYESIQFNP